MKTLDQNLFILINKTWANPYFDAFFPFWTDFQKSPLFYILVVAILGFVVFQKKWSDLFVIFACALGTFAADLINSNFLKPIFERQRPTEGILRTDFHGSYAFPSSHAVDMFFIAMFLSLFFPRFRLGLFILASLTALSRVYCGVHYPGDILSGALVGMIFGYIFYKGVNVLMKTKFKSLSLFILMFFSQLGLAFDDPTQGKPFFPWLWEDQFKPTLVKSVDQEGLALLGVATVSTLSVRQYDDKIFRYSQDGGNLLMSEENAQKWGSLGDGLAGFAVVGGQLFFDQKNGLSSARALLLTSMSHFAVAAIVQRKRPNNRTSILPFPSAFPSGHASSVFAIAGSLAYSYGWVGAIPGYLASTAIAISRVKEKRHWASDVVGGAFLGTFWARASFEADEMDKDAVTWVPVPIYDGIMISAMKDF